MRTLAYYPIFRHASHDAAIDLSEKLLAMAPVPMSKVLLQCSGSEANDTAVKLISRQGSYHGSTCVAISLTSRPAYHAGFGLPFPGFLCTGCPHYDRDAQPGETEAQFAQRLAESLEALILAEEYDILLVADEVITGFGRTGSLWWAISPGAD